MCMMFQVLAILEVRNVEALWQFETAAMKFMADYSGRLITAFESDLCEETSHMSEVHLLQFPSSEDFDAYRFRGHDTAGTVVVCILTSVTIPGVFVFTVSVANRGSGRFGSHLAWQPVGGCRIRIENFISRSDACLGVNLDRNFLDQCFGLGFRLVR